MSVGLGSQTQALGFALRHNFVHTDLHPGNIMIRMMDSHGNIIGECLTPVKCLHCPLPTSLIHTSTCMLSLCTDDAASGISSMLLAEGEAPSSSGGPSVAPPRQPLNKDDLRAQIVLLDFGLAEELTPDVRTRFISFLNCIPAGR
jgi:predicted unusual protein kinase regulating ubiquinone biosynthesis (AarF/ABC1/UbiB family)